MARVSVWSTRARRASMGALVLALALSACSDRSAPSDGAADAAMTSSQAADPTTMASDTAYTDEPMSSQPADDGLPGTRKTISCSSQRGEGTAWQLAQTCRQVSPATRPPCNPLNSCAMIESEIARSCALFDDGEEPLPEACEPAPRSPEAAVATVKRYYDAIAAHDLSTAWTTWGPNGDPEQTFDEFAKGYAQTASTSVKTGTPSRVEGAAGSLYVEVPVTVDATLDDGRRQRFTGKYVLRQVNRGMGKASQGWHIQSAELSPAPLASQKGA